MRDGGWRQAEVFSLFHQLRRVISTEQVAETRVGAGRGCETEYRESGG